MRKRAAEMALDIALQVLTEDSIYYSILKKIFITKIPLFHYFIENDKCLLLYNYNFRDYLQRIIIDYGKRINKLFV